MKALYLTYGETPVLSGVYKSQVIDLIDEISKDNETSISLYAIFPTVNKKMVTNPIGYISDQRELKQYLKDRDIKFKFQNTLLPQNFHWSSELAFKLYHTYNRLELVKYILDNEISVLHCRSYHAAYEAVEIKKKLVDLKIIFDPRGLFPEESDLKMKFKKKDFNFWKTTEKFIINNVELTIALSEPMIEHYSNLGANNIKLIYANSDNSKVRDLNDNGFNRERCKTMVYVGHLSTSGWHDIEFLKKQYLLFKNSYKETKLKIVTNSSNLEIKKHFLDIIDEIEIVSARNSQEVALILEDCHIGALPFKNYKNHNEEKIGWTMVGTKTLEYISAGIPVFCNKKCEGAIRLLDSIGYGVIFEPDNIKSDIKLEVDKFYEEQLYLNSNIITNDLFSTSHNAKIYRSVYREI